MAVKAPDHHKDVCFTIYNARDEELDCVKRYDDALAAAMRAAIATGSATIDVIVDSVNGARWFAGEHGAAMYTESPDADVFNRLEIAVNNLGRVYFSEGGEEEEEEDD